MRSFLVLALIPSLFYGCSSNTVRKPASDEIIMGGTWCEGAIVTTVANSSIEVRMPQMQLDVTEQQRDSRSCLVRIPIMAAANQAIKISKFTGGRSILVENRVDSWQERRELLLGKKPILGGLTTKQGEFLESAPYSETILGRKELGCGNNAMLYLDVGHVITGRKHKGKITISESLYRLEYEIVACQK